MTDVVWLHGTALNRVPFGPPGGARPLLPGHGSRAPVAPTVAAMARAMVPDLPDRFALVGHSLGGMIALHLACEMPDRCRALILVDAPLWIPRWLLPRSAAWLSPWNTHALSRWITAGIVGARTGNAAVRPAVRRSIRSMSARGLSRAVQAACRFDGRPLLPRLTVPTLALFGRRSPLTNRAMVQALDACPTVETRVLQTGHMLPYEDADGFDRAVIPFLETHP